MPQTCGVEKRADSGAPGIAVSDAESVIAMCLLYSPEMPAAAFPSSRRTPGPITTGPGGFAKVIEQRLSKQMTRRMGPRFRGDDVAVENVAAAGIGYVTPQQP